MKKKGGSRVTRKRFRKSRSKIWLYILAGLILALLIFSYGKLNGFAVEESSLITGNGIFSDFTEQVKEFFGFGEKNLLMDPGDEVLLGPGANWDGTTSWAGRAVPTENPGIYGSGFNEKVIGAFDEPPYM
jgi:hypothetical protein